MYPSFCFLIDMIMSFWVFISQCAESSNKSSIVHSPGEGSRALGSTKVSRNNYCFKRRYFLMLDFSGTIEIFFSPIYLVASAYNKLRQDEILFAVNRNEWKSPNVLEWHKICYNIGSRIGFLVGKMKRKLCTRYLQKRTWIVFPRFQILGRRFCSLLCRQKYARAKYVWPLWGRFVDFENWFIYTYC